MVMGDELEDDGLEFSLLPESLHAKPGMRAELLLVSRRQGRGRDALTEEERADQCIECEECTEACPQKIPIPDWLKKAHALLGSTHDP
jgi:ferredoxin